MGVSGVLWNIALPRYGKLASGIASLLCDERERPEEWCFFFCLGALECTMHLFNLCSSFRLLLRVRLVPVSGSQERRTFADVRLHRQYQNSVERICGRVFVWNFAL